MSGNNVTWPGGYRGCSLPFDHRCRRWLYRDPDHGSGNQRSGNHRNWGAGRIGRRRGSVDVAGGPRHGRRVYRGSSGRTGADLGLPDLHREKIADRRTALLSALSEYFENKDVRFLRGLFS